LADKPKDFQLDENLKQYFDLALERPENPLEDSAALVEIAANRVRYEAASPLNEGGMKELFKCTDTVMKRNVARAQMKNIEHAQEVDDFISEARIMASLEHPNIVPVYDLGLNDKGEPFFSHEASRRTKPAGDSR